MSRRPQTFQTPPPSGAIRKPLRYTDLYNEETVGRTPSYRPRIPLTPTNVQERDQNVAQKESGSRTNNDGDRDGENEDEDQDTVNPGFDVTGEDAPPIDETTDMIKVVDQSTISNVLILPDSHRSALSNEDYYSSDSLVTERTEPDGAKIIISDPKDIENETAQIELPKPKPPPPAVPPKKKSLKVVSSPPPAPDNIPEEIPMDVLPNKGTDLRYRVSDSGPPPGHIEPDIESQFQYPASAGFNLGFDPNEQAGGRFEYPPGVASPQVHTISRHVSASSHQSSTKSRRGGDDYHLSITNPGDAASRSESMRDINRIAGDLSLTPSLRSLPVSRATSVRRLNRTPGSSDSFLNDREMVLERYLETGRNLIPIYDSDMVSVSEVDYHENQGFIPEPESPTGINQSKSAGDHVLVVQDKFVPEPEPDVFDPTQRRPSVIDSEPSSFVPEPQPGDLAQVVTTRSYPSSITTDRRCGTGRGRRGKIIATGVLTALFLVAATIGVAVFFAFSGNSGQPDSELIMIRNCPTTIITHLRPGYTSRRVTWTEPESDSGNRHPPTHEPGTYFPEGITTVVYTFYDYVHDHDPVRCSFDVIILPPYDHSSYSYDIYDNYESDHDDDAEDTESRSEESTTEAARITMVT